MDISDRFEMVGVRGLFRPSGVVSFKETVELISAAIEAACENGARELLVDTTGLTGFASPDTFDRFFAVVEWAARGGGRLRLALVARANFIDPYKFGVVVAANRGLTAEIFTSEAEAIVWLEA